MRTRSAHHASISLTARALGLTLGSLRNHDDDAKVNVDEKLNLYFTHELRDTMKSFTLFITAKTIAELNPEHSDKFKIKILKIGRHGSRSPDNAKFGHFTSLSRRGRQRMYQEL